jgi:hypothetical protein
MADGARRPRQLRKRRQEEGPPFGESLDRPWRGQSGNAVDVRLPFGGIGRPFGRRFRHENHVPGRAHGVHERLVGLGAGPGRAADVVRAAIALAEVDVVEHELRRPAGEEVDQHRVDEARPGPAADGGLELADRVLVDQHHRDGGTGAGACGHRAQSGVVGLQLEGLEQLEASKNAGGERPSDCKQ